MPAPDARTVMLPIQYREAQVTPGSLDAAQRTFDLVWTAGAEVPRMDYWTGERYIEALEVSTKAIRLDRFRSGRAPVLDTHQRWSLASVLGVVVGDSVKIVMDQGIAQVKLSKREDVAAIVSDIADGIIANVSPGYVTHSYREELRDGVLYRIATDWEPLEISFVPVGADPDAGRRSAPAAATYPCTISRSIDGAAELELSLIRMRMRGRAASRLSD